MENLSVSRRAFLTGAAGMVAAAGMAGCAPQTKKLSTTSASADLPESWDMEADVVVIGSGAAGAATAWWALDGGLSTIVLEEREEAGGSAIESAGQVAVGATSVHKAAGYDATSDQYKKFLQFCGTEGVPRSCSTFSSTRDPKPSIG